MSNSPSLEPDPPEQSGFVHGLMTRRGILLLAGFSLLLVLLSAGAAVYYFSVYRYIEK